MNRVFERVCKYAPYARKVHDFKIVTYCRITAHFIDVQFTEYLLNENYNRMYNG